jgi:hypothetical protein
VHEERVEVVRFMSFDLNLSTKHWTNHRPNI